VGLQPRVASLDTPQCPLSSSRNISCCCNSTFGEPVPPRPVFCLARTISVDPFSFGPTPSSDSAGTSRPKSFTSGSTANIHSLEIPID
jgi:hypothetical protein